MNSDFLLGDLHTKIIGTTGRGKSGQLQHVARAIIKRGREGMVALDPHGEFARSVFEWAANPQNVNLHGRRIEFLDPAGSLTFGLNPLLCRDDTPQAAYDAAMVLVATVEAFFEQNATETPRLIRIIFVAAYICARKNLTVREMLELLSLGGEAIRTELLRDCDNLLVARELEELSVLAQKSPARFGELTESARNRFVTLLADHRMLRVLASKKSINPRAVLDGREILLADFSTIPPMSARFLGTLFTSAFVAAAVQRPPNKCAPCRFIIDEAENMITNQTARMLDQCRKFKFFLTAAIQRLGQLREKGDFVYDAVMTNCTATICFGLGTDPEAATLMADAILAPYNMEQWKPTSIRPTAIGNEKRILSNRSRADHAAEHESTGVTKSRTVGRGVTNSRTTGRSVGWSRQRGIVDTDGESYALGSVSGFSRGRTDANSSGWATGQGSNTGVGNTDSLQLTAPEVFAQPTVLGQGQALTNMTGTNAMSSQMGGHSSAESSLFSASDSEQYGSMSARSISESEGESESETESEGEAISESESEGEAHSVARGKSVGQSNTAGESEAFVTRYALLPTQYFSLEEVRHRMMAELMGLPRRHCVIKIENEPAFRTRTADLSPPFKSAYFKSLMLPTFRKYMIARSKYLRPAAEVDAEIAARFAALTNPTPEATPDLTMPEQLPIVDKPQEYAREFLKRTASDSSKQQRGKFRVVRGKDGVDSKDEGSD